MTIDQLKSKVAKLASESQVKVQEIWDKYFFEAFLIRLSKSPYKEDFVLKGGYLLEYLIGIQHRATLDLDFSYQNLIKSHQTIIHKIETTLQQQTNDSVTLSILNVSPVKNKGKEGIRIKINGSIKNIKKTFTIDVVSGDFITPYAMDLPYLLLLENKEILIKAYNLETMLAEKFQTIIEKNVQTTRMKDFYDVYLLVHHKDLNASLCREAIIQTFHHRQTSLHKDDLTIVLRKIKESLLIKNLYEDYTKKNGFASRTTFMLIMEALDLVFSFL